MGRSAANRNMLSRVFGIAFLVLAAYLCISLFWAMGNRVKDAIVLTGYVVKLSDHQQVTFGYGGESSDEQVSVPFQSPEMSNVSFAISREGEEYKISARDDEVSIHRTKLGANQSDELSSGEKFEVRGPLGRATFRAEMNPTTDDLTLHLVEALYRELYSENTRLTTGPNPAPLPSIVDEIMFRTAPFQNSPLRRFRISTLEGRLRLFEEPDLANSANASREPIVIEPGQPCPSPCPLGTINVTFRHYLAKRLGMDVNLVKLFAFKLLGAIAFAGLAFLVVPRSQKGRWPFGLAIFGAAAFFVCLSVILSARDMLFYPHRQAFYEYLFYLFPSVLMLCALRIPFSPDEKEGKAGDKIRVFLICPLLFSFSYWLIHDPFNAQSFSTVSIIGSLFKACVIVFGLWYAAVILSVVVHYVARVLLDRFVNEAWNSSRMWLWIVLPAIFFLLTIGGTAWSGGREALTIFGLRIHLPTLFLPLIVLWMSIAGFAVERSSAKRQKWLVLFALSSLICIVVYRVSSKDNGGTIILAIGMTASLLFSSRNLRIPIAAFAVLLVGAIILSWIDPPIRFELAWGGDQAGILYYDKAKNLRLSRDMARASGQGLDLIIPAELRSNAHNDLMAAYVMAFFGKKYFAVMFFAYFIFYNYTFGTLYSELLARKSSEHSTDSHRVRGRSILLAFSGALVLTFAFQSLWVTTASLQRLVPLTGLDLQPISISGISVTSFFLVLLGSVAVSLTLNRTLPPEERHDQTITV